MDPILLKILVAAVVAFVISAVIGKFLVPALRRWKAGQSIKEDGPTWHMSKQGTPTMGGLMFILATIIVVLVVNGPAILSGDWTSVIVLVFALVFGAIGFLDDYAKIKKKENTGLTAGQKFLLQLAAAILFIVLLRKCGILSPNLYVPFFGVELHLPWVVYLIFAVLVITGTVNAVNITDGLDGLSSSVTLPVCAFFAAAFGWAWVKWQQSGTAGMAVFAAALFGGLVGFLVYNHYPAKVFMGDTGSLFLGGAVCGMAFALDMPLILILVGIIYRVKFSDLFKELWVNLKKMKFSLTTIGLVVALAYVMGDSGQTLALGLWIAGAGAVYPFLAPILGWIGTYVTGSDTSANILFSGLQSGVGDQMGAGSHLGVNGMKDLLVGAGAAGGVVGKMISPQSLTVAATAIGLVGGESTILRKVFKYSIILLILMCILAGLMSTPILSWILPASVK